MKRSLKKARINYEKQRIWALKNAQREIDLVEHAHLLFRLKQRMFFFDPSSTPGRYTFPSRMLEPGEVVFVFGSTIFLREISDRFDARVLFYAWSRLGLGWIEISHYAPDSIVKEFNNIFVVV